jgi:hypothetical protein
MKYIPFLVFFAFIVSGCTGQNSVESKWRVLDEQTYAPEIDEETVFTDLDELEKLIFAPTTFFKNKGGYHSFEQNIGYITKSIVNDEKRELRLEETIKFSADKRGSFKMRYRNNSNEGWSMIWIDNFLYRRQFGGEYTKAVSMGEHIFLKESLFNSIPAIYSILRGNAKIQSHDRKKTGKSALNVIRIVFSDKKVKRDPIPEKRYLQNLQGTEEMKNDQLVTDLAKKEKSGITGEMIIHVDDSYSVVRMEINAGFDLVKEEISFLIEGERELSKKEAEKLEVPKYNEEYHRRTLDASINIMKDSKNDKKRDEQVTESD